MERGRGANREPIGLKVFQDIVEVRQRGVTSGVVYARPVLQLQADVHGGGRGARGQRTRGATDGLGFRHQFQARIVRKAGETNGQRHVERCPLQCGSGCEKSNNQNRASECMAVYIRYRILM